MPRYIDADNIKLKGISIFDQNLEILIPLSDVRKSLQMTPTADVISVVRCKDCYLRNTEACPFCFWDCGELMGYTEDNDFCSYGKKRKEDG